MRHIALFALLLPYPALADQILATSRITAVTVYPAGAQITREVSFTAPAGPLELLITDLPADMSADLIRLSSQTASLGAYALRTDRLPPRDIKDGPARVAAKAQVEAAEAAQNAAQAGLDAINARIEAAEAQAGFLRGIKAEGDAVTVDGLSAIATMIGSGVLAARQAALAAATDLPAAQKTFDQATEALTKAQDALQALPQSDEDYAALSVAVTLPAAGETQVTMITYMGDASWQPVYDLKLSRKGSPSLTLSRGVQVSQYSAEDWVGVDLTLSTAQPSEQAAPSQLWPELHSIGDDQPEAKVADDMGETMAAPMVVGDVAPQTAQMAIQGDMVVYHYPSLVDVAAGVENLRLTLDEMQFTPTIKAVAVPRYDKTAFYSVSFSNDSDEILLPGQIFLIREGELIGGTQMETLSPGAKAEIGFGAIEGLKLTRDMPQRAEGDRGIFTSSTQIEETAVLKVENLTEESWPIRLMDQVPYSEQEDLSISFTADPEPAETDVKGQRGILAWEFDLPPGETREVRLQSVMRWPEGKVLR